MSGYESNRFIDLSERYAKHLICSICLNIYNNAVKSECEHTFCKSCVENWIKRNHRECPECREEFSTRKRTTGMRSDLNLVIVSNFVFKKNLTANNMINEFKIKCDYESNGCPEVVELGSLSEHLKNCEHWLCPKCKFIDRPEGHDCFERMKTDRNRLNVKLNEIESKLNSSEIKNLKLENQLNEINHKVWSQDLKNVWKKEITLSSQSIYFGTHLTLYSTIKFSFDFLKTVYFSTNPELKKSKDYENYGNYSSNIKGLEELKFCSDSEFPVIIMKLKSLKSCDEIREAIQLSEPSKGWFDIESEDIKERYITIKVCPQTTTGYIIIGYIMSVLSVTGHIGIPLKCQSIDLNEAKRMFNSVSNNENSDSDTKPDSDSEDSDDSNSDSDSED